MEQQEKNKPTRRELIFAALSTTLLMILLPLSETIRTHAPDQIYKLVAGFVLGSFGAAGYAVTVQLVRAAKAGELLNTIDTNKWMRPFSCVLAVFLIILGLVTWYVSWEGTTGVFYGIGALIGGVLVNGSFGSVSERGK